MTVKRLVGERSATLAFILIALSYFVFLLYPETVSEGVRSGLYLSYKSVLPAILPFMVVSDLLLCLDLRVLDESIGRVVSSIFSVSPIGSRAILLGVLSGFPIGARIISSLLRDRRISPEEAERLLYLSSIASPAFIITGVGYGILGSVACGIKLYLIVLATHLAVGFILFPRKRREKPLVLAPERYMHGISLTDSIESAALSGLKIAAYLSFFSVCCAISSKIIPNRLIAALVASLLEIGSGAGMAAKLSQDVRYPVLGFCLGFSGISVCLQLKGVIKSFEISMRPYLTQKFLCGLLAAFFAFFILA